MHPEVAGHVHALTQVAGLLFVVLPLLSSAWIGIGAFAGRLPTERRISQVTGAVYSILTLLSLAIAARVVTAGAFEIPLGTWFSLGGYHFSVRFRIDGLSATFLVMTTTLLGIIGKFSSSYMHRERGFARFFALLHLFGAGMSLLELGASIDVVFAGWELVGLTSMLLIAFFQYRSAPVKNALRAFTVYRTCDMGFLLAAVAIHHFAHTSDLHDAIVWLGEDGHALAATTVAASLLMAAMGKSALLPVSGWMPRAMEGPTPSGALFYGALSIHSGVYLMLRAAPLLDHAPVVRGALVALGALTALYATVTGRTRSDAKTGLAYASLAQVGVMFVEVGLGFRTIVLVHVASHTFFRTLQFLQAPSALRADRLLRQGLGVLRLRAVDQVERRLPARLELVLYRFALERFFLDTLLERFVGRPFAWAAAQVDATGTFLERHLWGEERQPEGEAEAARAGALESLPRHAAPGEPGGTPR